MGQTGTNFYGLEADGLKVDSASSAGVAPAPCQPSGRTDVAYMSWDLLQGESEAVRRLDHERLWQQPHRDWEGSTQALFWLAEQDRLAQGFGSVAAQGTGVIVSAPGVPATYNVTASGYQAASSRWNLVDAGVSMLDSNGHLTGWAGPVRAVPDLLARGCERSRRRERHPLPAGYGRALDRRAGRCAGGEDRQHGQLSPVLRDALSPMVALTLETT